MDRRMVSEGGSGGGFTIVEMLTVIAIITLLMGLLLPALAGAKKSSQKMKEINALRQIGVAWNQYAFSQGDAALPGFLEPRVQEVWNAKFEFIDSSVIPPAPNSPAQNWKKIPNLAGPWTWRLLPYLDYNHEMVHGHIDEPDYDRTSMTVAQIASSPYKEEAERIAYEPGFGYNAIYVGGWWEMTPTEGAETSIPRYKYYDATADLDGDTVIDSEEYARVVVRSVAQIRRSTELVIFCSSSSAALRVAGPNDPDRPRNPDNIYEKVRDDLPGEHWISPSRLGDQEQWTLFEIQGFKQSEAMIQVLTENPAPIGRYTGNAAVLYADGHTGAVLPGKLADQRAFIDIADSADFEHR